jgi:hypothetical protein
MHNLMNFVTLFIFVYSLLGTIKLTFNFISAMMSTPPKPFELTNVQMIVNGGFISYIITYIIYLFS